MIFCICPFQLMLCIVVSSKTDASNQWQTQEIFLGGAAFLRKRKKVSHEPYISKMGSQNSALTTIFFHLMVYIALFDLDKHYRYKSTVHMHRFDLTLHNFSPIELTEIK